MRPSLSLSILRLRPRHRTAHTLFTSKSHHSFVTSTSTSAPQRSLSTSPSSLSIALNLSFLTSTATATATMSNRTAPVPPPQWGHDAAAIRKGITDAIAADKKVNDAVAALKPEECGFDNVFKALALSEAQLEAVAEPLVFYSNVAPDDSKRDAAVEGQRELSDYGTSSEARLDVYRSLVSARDNIKSGHGGGSGSGVKELDEESQRLVEKMVRERERAGLGLEEEKRDEVLKIKNEINTLVVDFMKAYNEEKGEILFDEADLVGVPTDILSGLTRKKDKEGKEKLAMTFKTPEYVPVMRYARLSSTRRRALIGYESKLSSSSSTLEKIISLRRRLASLLGYDTWADYKTEPKMIKSAMKVKEFLDDLGERLRTGGERDRMALLDLKKGEREKWGGGVVDQPDKLFIWDYSYFSQRRVERDANLDDEKIKEYFPVSVVVAKILDIYQTLLSVRFVPVEKPDVWHKDVQQFAVWDAETETGTGTGEKDDGFLGYLHLDLFPRENKYSHAAVWGLIPGYTKEDGTRNYPVAAMVANLAKETPDRPALMKHDDVVTFFHEMGHAFHQLCSKTTYGRFHGTSVARDFVEAPSQMLENWCWLPKQLKTMSSHYKTQEVLPTELIDAILKSRNINSGLFNLRQLFFGSYDLRVFTAKEGEIDDYTKLWCEMREKISMVEFDGEYAPGQSSFAHIVGGYDAGYYGYLYSLVFAADMFKTVFSPDPLSPALGHRYRQEILLPGGSRDEMDSLKAFLGREPRNDAFLDQILGRDSEEKLTAKV